ncbi:unnamed protein product [Pleuronectes platessa]|uniref:Protein kinase domain-containing protein n=1 Tax=Pleuronectes platessa TaxID=8262 RepID=A0A9N7YQN6_PLEPL|nr:unnamed protein product [Pleuronectes platessa]
MDTKEIVALKIVSKAVGQKELDILEALREIGQDKNNFVKFNGHHTHCDKILLEFEKLDKTLFDWLGMSGGKGRPLSEIQAITKQLLVSLTALKSLNLVHADIKPNNIMLVDQQRQPSKVKLIDFGLATRVSELETGRNCQIIGFRAPEVMLGLPLNEAMDMWALGCIVAYLYLGTCLYKLGTCKYQAMKNLRRTRKWISCCRPELKVTSLAGPRAATQDMGPASPPRSCLVLQPVELPVCNSASLSALPQQTDPTRHGTRSPCSSLHT